MTRTAPPARFPGLRAAAALLAMATGCKSMPEPSATAWRGGEAAAESAASKIGAAPANGAPSVDLGSATAQPMPELTPEMAVGAHLDLGRVFESKGDYEAAVAEYRAALDVEGRVPAGRRADVHRRLAGVYIRQGRLPEADAQYAEARKLAPGDPDLLNDIGYAAYLQGRWDEAIEHLTAASEAAPDDRRIVNNLGLALAAAGRTDEAYAAMVRGGGPAAAHANLGYILAAGGEDVAARRHYGESLSTSPGLDRAREALDRLDSEAAATALAGRPAAGDPSVRPAAGATAAPGLPPLPR